MADAASGSLDATAQGFDTCLPSFSPTSSAELAEVATGKRTRSDLAAGPHVASVKPDAAVNPSRPNACPLADDLWAQGRSGGLQAAPGQSLQSPARHCLYKAQPGHEPPTSQGQTPPPWAAPVLPGRAFAAPQAGQDQLDLPPPPHPPHPRHHRGPLEGPEGAGQAVT